MIEIGRDYRLVTLKLCDEGYDTESITVTVTGREGNLLQVNGCEVINLASPLVHALIDEQERAAYGVIHAELAAGLRLYVHELVASHPEPDRGDKHQDARQTEGDAGAVLYPQPWNQQGREEGAEVDPRDLVGKAGLS